MKAIWLAVWLIQVEGCGVSVSFLPMWNWDIAQMNYWILCQSDTDDRGNRFALPYEGSI